MPPRKLRRRIAHSATHSSTLTDMGHTLLTSARLPDQGDLHAVQCTHLLAFAQKCSHCLMQADAAFLTEESCTQYNVLKLARWLFRHTGDAGAWAAGMQLVSCCGAAAAALHGLPWGWVSAVMNVLDARMSCFPSFRVCLCVWRSKLRAGIDRHASHFMLLLLWFPVWFAQPWPTSTSEPC